MKRWDLREKFSVLRWPLKFVVSSLSLSSMAMVIVRQMVTSMSSQVVGC